MIQSTARVPLILAAVAGLAIGQSANPSTILSAGYVYPAFINVAPGQIITVFAAGVGGALKQPVFSGAGTLPTSLAGISVTLGQQTLVPAPILQVTPAGCVVCGYTAAVTLQIPYELQLPPPNGGLSSGVELFVSENGVAGNKQLVNPLNDQVNILTVCDIAVGGSGEARCPWEVTHLNGLLVSNTNPASAGEELVAYAVGLGVTNPAMQTGHAATQPTPTVETFRLGFNFAAGFFPSSPPGSAPAPLYTGLTPNYAGLYQINFVVPSPPAGSQPCGESVTANLTVSVGGLNSFGGAAICVSVPAN
jgi:uncharacterized protein (TIGR03437 family)